MSTTEVTLALFAEVMSAMGAKGTADALGLQTSGDSFKGLSGPQLWKWTANGGIEPASAWLRNRTGTFNDYPDALMAQGPEMPVAQGPDGFVYFSTSNGNHGDKIVRIRPQ